MAAFEVLALDTATPQIRAPGASDTYTFPRAVELPLGTANGVLYLNASNVVTSGSSLTFNGTELSVGGPVRTGSDGSNVGLYLGASSIRQAATGGLFIDANSTGAAGGIFFRDSSSFTTRMQIDASGNLGLGVTPSAWSGKAIEVGSKGTAIWNLNQQNSSFTCNAYYDGAYKYGGTGLAASYQQAAGIHYWYTAPSGTAGNAISFTQAMTLDASGNLLVGLTSALANGKLQVSGGIGLSGNTQIRQATNSDGNTLQVFATQLVAGIINSVAYGYSGGALIAGVGNSDNLLIFEAGRSTATDGRFRVGNTTSGNSYFSLEKNSVLTLYAETGLGNVVIGNAAIATNATNGFLYVPTCAGTPTGTPTTYTGRSPIVVDTTNNKLYFYSGGAWRDAGP